MPKSTPARGKPGRKFKLTTKGLITVIFLVGMLVVGLYALFARPSAIDRLSLTYLDTLTKDSLAYTPEAYYQDSYSAQDYSIYGETLVLYQKPYGTVDYDDLYGKNVMVKNLETGQEQIFTFNGGADSGIPLGELEPGVYEVYVYDEWTKKRVYFEEAMEAEPFVTMRRNKEITTVNLYADKDYLHKLGIDSDKDYLYLTVTSSLPKVKVVDVLIDPSGLVMDLNVTLPTNGYEGSLINEAATSYQFAQEIKDYLQDAGLRVEISRSSNAPNGYYGPESRVGLGYEKQAKVFLSLAMSDTDAPRPYLLSSPYTAGNLGNTMVHTLEANGVELYDISGSSLTDFGSGLDTYIVNEDYTNSPYSMYVQLRESGGKATFAGKGASFTANSDYSERPGMYGILFFYASTKNQDSQTYFLTNEGDMARSIAESIIEYFHIPLDSEQEAQEKSPAEAPKTTKDDQQDETDKSASPKQQAAKPDGSADPADADNNQQQPDTEQPDAGQNDDQADPAAQSDLQTADPNQSAGSQPEADDSADDSALQQADPVQDEQTDF